MSNKKVVVITPQNIKEHLSTEEWQSFINTIDKLLSLGVETCISYTDIVSPCKQLPA